jgi:hypothetical protein
MMKKTLWLILFCSFLFLPTKSTANYAFRFQSEKPAFSIALYSAFLYKNVSDTIPSSNKHTESDNPELAAYYFTDYYEKYRDKRFEMPGYTGKTGCNWPINEADFEKIKAFIADRAFESRRLLIAKDIVSNNCFTSRQIRHLAALFDFESSKVNFLKFAYAYTFDTDNYFLVMDVLDFTDSIIALDTYIKAYE